MQPASTSPVSPSRHLAPDESDRYRRRGAQRAESGFALGTGDDEGVQSDANPDIIETPEVEVQPQKSIRTPVTPTDAELAEHRDNGHLEYREWCPDCVEGFGREWAHKA